MKPDDVSQEDWDAAYEVLSSTSTGVPIEGLDFVIVQEAVARAITAAVAAEREACADRASIAMRDAAWNGKGVTVGLVLSAIRARSQP